MSKSITLSNWSNFCVLCCLQCSHSCATSWHRNGPVGLWWLPYLVNVHPWSHKCSMFVLSHRQSGLGSKSGGTCKLWQLQDATHVPVWSTIGKMCSLQFCDISWGLSKCCRTEVQQLKIIIHPKLIIRSYNLGFSHITKISSSMAASSLSKTEENSSSQCIELKFSFCVTYL